MALVKVQNPGISPLMISDARLLLQPGAVTPEYILETPNLLAMVQMGKLTVVASKDEGEASVALATPQEINRLEAAEAGYAISNKALIPDIHLMLDTLGFRAQRVLVANATGAKLNKGTLVCINGWSAALNAATVIKAVASDITRLASYALPEDLNNNAVGPAFLYGHVLLNLTAESVGLPVYLSATAGQATLIAPTNTGTVQQVGVVSKTGTQGTVFFFPALHLVQSTPAATNQATATAAGEGDDTVKLSDFNALLTKLKSAGLMAADCLS